MNPLTVAIFLATTNKVAIDAILRPLKQRWPNREFWWFFYVSLITGGLVGWFAEINIFSDYVANVVLARLLTSILIGGGSGLVHDLFNRFNR